MISDETFPIDLISDEEDLFEDEIGIYPKFHSNNEINSLSSSENRNSSTSETEHSMIGNSMETDRLLSTQSIKLSDEDTDKDETTTTHPEVSFDKTCQKNNVNLPPPKAPIKKKSFSCHNLNMKKRHNNYDHVESKVKKLIENLAEDRRKTLSRHKSMPVCVTQAPVIEETTTSDLDKDDSEAKKELRRKSIMIYELEEKCEMKDNQIYELVRERSRMRMVFDKLRVEIQELKDIEKQYQKLKAQYSPFKSYKNATIQTDDDTGFESQYLKSVEMRESIVITQHQYHNEHNHVLLNPRYLEFENSELDQTHTTEINNTSLDALLSETSTEINEIDNEVTSNINNEIPNIKPKNLNKKKKKLRKFFRFVPCVSFPK